jgi:Ca2+-binding EF-hand superfamily protein
MVGLYLLMNFLLAVIFMNYKALISSKAANYEIRRDEYFKQKFDILDFDKNKALTTEQLSDALGGEDIVNTDQRLEKLLWQA